MFVRQVPMRPFAGVSMGVDMAYTSPVGMDVDVDPLAHEPAQHVRTQQDQHAANQELERERHILRD